MKREILKIKFEKLLIILLIISLFAVSVGNVYAFENNTQDNYTIASDFDDNLSFVEEDVLSKSYSLNGGDFEDIQKIVDKANSGDTIKLSGTFKAKDDSSLIRINKKLTITSSNGAVLNAQGKSGIFYLDKKAKNTVISGLTFMNGKRVIASAIYIDAAHVTLDKCTFKNNHGTDNGGGAVATTYTLNGAKGLTVKNCIFKGNRAPASSAALAAFSTNFKIINTTFEKNVVSNYFGRTGVGGALIAGINKKGTYGIISGCTFKNNYAKTDNKEASRGGAAGIQDNTIVENCRFISNNADNGGALYIYGSATIKNTNFTSNKGNKYGGAIYAPNKGKITITNSHFKKNIAYAGGSIYHENNTIIVKNSNFKGNNATNGGSIYALSSLNIEKSSFTNNLANKNGGCIYTTSKLTIKESSFGKNNAIRNI